MKQYTTGAILSPPDERDYQFKNLIAGVALRPLPATYKNELVSGITVVD